ncbi:MAG: TetR/AcrR family transcriptional regulator, partial [Sediminibacterium sp.]
METQNRIVTKTHELFMLYGIRSVSMDEIANHLGMSKKTIY